MFFSVYHLIPDFYLALNNIHFLQDLGKIFRNNAPLTILSNTHPGISSNTTEVNQISTPPTPSA